MNTSVGTRTPKSTTLHQHSITSMLWWNHSQMAYSDRSWHAMDDHAFQGIERWSNQEYLLVDIYDVTRQFLSRHVAVIQIEGKTFQPQRSSSVTIQYCNWWRPSQSKRLTFNLYYCHMSAQELPSHTFAVAWSSTKLYIWWTVHFSSFHLGPV